jgi:hypothetical protein
MQRFAILATLAPILLFAASAEAGTIYSGPTGALPTDSAFAGAARGRRNRPASALA